MKRVLIPVHWLTDFGGLHENVLDTAECLLGGGWQVTVIAPPSKVGARFIAAGANVLAASLDDIATSVSLAVSHGPFDLVHAHPFQARRVGAAVAEALGIPLVVTIHGQYDDEFAQYGAAVKAIICVSSHIAEFVAQLCPPLADRLAVIPNGVDFAAFSPPPMPCDQPSKTIIGVASRLDPDKGVLSRVVADLIDHLAATGSPGQFELRVAGERFYGPPQNPLTEAIDRAAKSDAIAVVHAGWIGERRRLRRFFAEADLVVAPGRAAMEAIACATPTIAAASRGYIGLVTERNLALAHATNFGGVQEEATVYSPAAMVEHFRQALLMTRAETEALRQSLQKLHDLRSIQAAHLALCDRLFAFRRAA